MGRELRRKQAKKEGKSLEREEIIEKQPIKKLLIITISLVILVAIIYLVTALFITKELDWFSKNKEESNGKDAQSNIILASTIFKQAEEEYYVYFYDFNEEKNTTTDLVDSGLLIEKVYKVNTSSALNNNYISDVSNKNAKTLEQLKVVSPTLIKISGDTITEYYEGNEIINKLQG